MAYVLWHFRNVIMITSMTMRRINYIGAISIYNHSLINHTKIAEGRYEGLARAAL